MIKFITGLMVLFSLVILPVGDMWAMEGGSAVLPLLPKTKATEEGLCDPKYAFITNIPLRGQETGSWCWAAAQQMVMWYRGPDYYNEQCTIANAVLKNAGYITPSENCCLDDRKNLPMCARTAWPNFSLVGFNFTQVDVTNVNDPLGSGGVDGWDVLKAQICHGNPFLITLKRPTSSGYISHQYIVNGYQDQRLGSVLRTGTTLYLGRVVYVIDPSSPYFDNQNHELPDLKVWSYGAFKFDIDGNAVHSRDFIDISPQ